MVANGKGYYRHKEVEEISYPLSIVVRPFGRRLYLHDPEGKIISWNEGAEKI